MPCTRCHKREPVNGRVTCNTCYINKKSRRKFWKKTSPELKYKQRARLKLSVFDAYGGRFCACCGENNIGFLTIDHINNDGKQHREQMIKEKGSIGGLTIYQWLKSNNFPPGFRVLCYNCNCGRNTNGGVCPHVKPYNA